MWHPLRFLARRRRPEADFSEEIAAHLAIETDRLVADGLAPAAAALEARRRFGNPGRVQEDFHDRRAIPLVESVTQHLGRAARRLRRAPVFSATVALTLMLGIGATTAVFSLVNGVLLRPLPFADPARLVDLSHGLTLRGASNVDQSDATYLHYLHTNRVFTALGAWQAQAVNLSSATDPRRVAAARVTSSVFAVLGVSPLRGRVFVEDEDRPGAARTVLLGEALWRDHYAADPGIIGRLLEIDGVSCEVVGVMPARFEFPDGHTALWLPLPMDPAHTRSATFDLRGIGRLKDGVSPRAAEADLQRLLPGVPGEFPGRLTAQAIEMIRMTAVVRPLRDLVVGSVTRALWIVLGAAAFLLLIACANVANLFLVRSEERQHDLAVRRALGAGRGTIVAEFLAEGLLLAGLGGGLGLLLASLSLGVLRSLEGAVNIPRLGDVGLDGGVLAACAGTTLLAALIMSLVPAVRAGAGGSAAAFFRAGRAATAGRSRHRIRQGFVVAQLALALVLVAGAGLMARSFQSLRSVPAGFDATQSYTFRIALPSGAYPTTADATTLILRAIDAVSALPGIQAAGVVSRVPLDGEARHDTAAFVEDRMPGMGLMPVIHQVSYASPGSFAALGIPLVQGHGFSRPDPAQAPLEVIVTRALARRYWGEESMVGKRLRLAPLGPWFTVVGVTADVHGTRLEDPPDETVYLPLVTAPGNAAPAGGAGPVRWIPREIAIVVRSRGDASPVTSAVLRALRTVAPAVPVYDVRAMSVVVARATARTTFTLELLGIAGLAALLIGAVGLYGVVSYMVSLRSREMAVRMALGARPAALQSLVLGQAVTVAAVGVVLGVAGSLGVTRLLGSLLFDVAPRDPATLVAAALAMSLVALFASWLPARRAAAMDPARALRADD